MINKSTMIRLIPGKTVWIKRPASVSALRHQRQIAKALTARGIRATVESRPHATVVTVITKD